MINQIHYLYICGLILIWTVFRNYLDVTALPILDTAFVFVILGWYVIYYKNTEVPFRQRTIHALILAIVFIIIYYKPHVVTRSTEGMSILIDGDHFDDYSFPNLTVKNKIIPSEYTAVIVEPREHKALEFVLHNFLENLDDKWNIILIHSKDNDLFVDDIIDRRLTKYKNRIQTINLGVSNMKYSQYNELFYNPLFYDLIPTEIFLSFQTDTMIFAENKHQIYDFIKYDYVGAPWKTGFFQDKKKQVGNGGLSLRRKSKMLELLEYKDVAFNKPGPFQIGRYLAEDRFFSGYEIPKVKLYKPDAIKAREFSIESIYYEKPFGVHKCWLYFSNDEMKQMLYTKYPNLLTLVNLNH